MPFLFTHDRLCMVKSHILRDVLRRTQRIKRSKPWKTISTLRCECLAYGINGSGWVFLKGTLWDTRQRPRGNIALPSIEAVNGGPYITPYSWDQSGEQGFNFRAKERSVVCDSDKGSFSEAPCGEAGPNPFEQRTGDTTLIGEEHLFSSSQFPENLEGLT